MVEVLQIASPLDRSAEEEKSTEGYAEMPLKQFATRLRYANTLEKLDKMGRDLYAELRTYPPERRGNTPRLTIAPTATHLKQMLQLVDEARYPYRVMAGKPISYYAVQ